MNSVRDLLRILRQHILSVAVVFALVLSGVVAGVYLRKPAFESEAKVLITFEGFGISLSRAEYQIGNTQILAVEAITSQGEILRSRNLVEQVIDEIGVEALRDPPPASVIVRFIGGVANSLGDAIEAVLVRLGLATPMSERDSLVAKLNKSLSVFPVRQSHIVTVSVRWHRPEIARLLLRKVMETYIATNKAIGQRANNYEVYAEQTKQLSAELSEAENVLLQFKLKNNIMDLPREKQVLMSNTEKLSALLEGTAAIAGYATAPAEDPAATSDIDSAAVSQVSSLQAQLTSFRIELARLRISSTPDNRSVQQLVSQIAEVEKTIAGILARVTRSLEDSRTRLRAVNEAEAGYERIRRDVEMARDAYQTYRKVTEDRRSMQSRNMQINIQVVDSPSLPLRASGPSRLMLLAAGLPFSLTCSIGLISLLLIYRSWKQAERGRKPEAGTPA